MRSTTARRACLALAAAALLVSPVASARHHHGHADGGVDRDEADEAATDGGATSVSAAPESDESADDDGGAPVVVPRTAAQAERRDALVARERELVRGLAHREGKKKISSRERQAIGMHWRYVMRLSRIRELAEQDHDTAVVARVDALIERADKKFGARMDEIASPLVATDGGAR